MIPIMLRTDSAFTNLLSKAPCLPQSHVATVSHLEPAKKKPSRPGLMPTNVEDCLQESRGFWGRNHRNTTLWRWPPQEARAYEGAERAPSGRKHHFGFHKMRGVPHLIVNFERGNWKSTTINIYKEDFWLGSTQVFGETQPFCSKKIVVSASQKGFDPPGSDGVHS